MNDKEKLKKIYLKTYITLLAFITLSVILSVVVSFLKYDSYYIDSYYLGSFIFFNSLFFFNKNLLFMLALFNIFTFSLLISKTDISISSDKKLFFYQLTSRAIYILLFFTGYYFFSTELLNPMLSDKIEQQRINTARARELVIKAESHYKAAEYDRALLYYEQFIMINDRNETVNDLVRALRLKSKQQQVTVVTVQDDFPDREDYAELAALYDSRGEYLTAWYYYEYVIESDSSRRAEVRKRVEEIKQILAYKHKMLSAEDREEWLDQNARMIKRVHELRKAAGEQFDKRAFQKSYFLFQDILRYNNRIKDSIDGLENSLYRLSTLSVEIDKIRSKELFSGKKDLVFMPALRTIMYIESLKRVIDEESGNTLYYFYNTRVYRFDEDGELIALIFSPYGELKGSGNITFYSYLQSNREIEYYPLIEKIKRDELEKHVLSSLSVADERRFREIYKGEGNYYVVSKTISDEDRIFAARVTAYAGYNLFNSLPAEIEKIYYEGALEREAAFVLNSKIELRGRYKMGLSGEQGPFTLDKYYEERGNYYVLKEGIGDSEKMELWEILSGTGAEVYPYIFQLNTDIDVLYNFSYDYQSALNFPLRKLSRLIDFTLEIGEGRALEGSGFNNSFLITAVLDKIATLFLFFFLNLLLISFAWRRKAQYYGLIPNRFLFCFLIIAIFTYFFIEFLRYLNTEFYSFLAYSTELPLGALVAICLVINTILTGAALIYLAATKVEN